MAEATYARMKEQAEHKLAVQQAAETASFETADLSASSQSTIARQQELKESIEKRKRSRELALPTNDGQVKLKLREFDEPICLFGEAAPERRERLRDVMLKNLDIETLEGGELRGAETLAERQALSRPQAQPADDEEEKRKEVFFSEGSAELKEARKWLLVDSIGRAARRLEAERRRVEAECADVGAHERSLRDMGARLRGVENQLSNFADERPISFCSFSPTSSTVATGSWSALVKLWSMPDCKCVATLKGHAERISGLAWHPQACVSQSATSCNLLSASCDATAKLWALDGSKPLGTLVGHVGRLSRCAFHPSGRYAGTAGFDTSWRLWDVETCSELLLQEGHSRSLYAINFHPDGSLVATSGLDAIVRLWDIRAGRSVQAWQGHVKQVLGLDFSPNGVHLASGSDDHSVRLWDLRKKKCLYTIPAHSSLISHVRFEPSAGRFLVSASYDNKVKLWSTRDFSLLKTMEGHEGRIMCADASDDGKYFATAAMDRTWKLWGSD